MSDPHKPTPEFSSEVRHLETPEHRRRRRRSGITASIFGIALGTLLLVVGVHAMHTGEMVYGTHSSLPITGGEACLLALVVMALSVWLLWRFLTNKQ